MNTLKNLTNKDMVNKIKDYADIADVSYAFLNIQMRMKFGVCLINFIINKPSQA